MSTQSNGRVPASRRALLQFLPRALRAPPPPRRAPRLLSRPLKPPAGPEEAGASTNAVAPPPEPGDGCCARTSLSFPATDTRLTISGKKLPGPPDSAAGSAGSPAGGGESHGNLSPQAVALAGKKLPCPPDSAAGSVGSPAGGGEPHGNLPSPAVALDGKKLPCPPDSTARSVGPPAGGGEPQGILPSPAVDFAGKKLPCPPDSAARSVGPPAGDGEPPGSLSSPPVAFAGKKLPASTDCAKECFSGTTTNTLGQEGGITAVKKAGGPPDSAKEAPSSQPGPIPAKHRCLFLELHEEEGAMPFKEYCRSIQMIDSAPAPGSTDEFESPSNECSKIMRGLSALFGHLHDGAKKSLKGQFSIENIWVTKNGKVKFRGNLRLRNNSQQRAGNDLHNLARELRKHIFDQGEPPEVSVWLGLMSSPTAARQELVIRCHTCLMSPWNKLSAYNWMYKRLWVLQKKRRKMYHDIARKLPYDGTWKALAKKNSYLYEVYYNKDSFGNRKARYSGDARGLLRFVRNAVEHLHEKSLRNGIQSFDEWEACTIICSTFPLLFGSLQVLMNEHQQLSKKILEQIMG